MNGYDGTAKWNAKDINTGFSFEVECESFLKISFTWYYLEQYNLILDAPESWSKRKMNEAEARVYGSCWDGELTESSAYILYSYCNCWAQCEELMSIFLA